MIFPQYKAYDLNKLMMSPFFGLFSFNPSSELNKNFAKKQKIFMKKKELKSDTNLLKSLPTNDVNWLR